GIRDRTVTGVQTCALPIWPRGQWNTFEITMKGDRLWVKLNGEEVISNAQLPGVPKRGAIALQHHGGYNTKTGQWTGPPSLVQFQIGRASCRERVWIYVDDV